MFITSTAEKMTTKIDISVTYIRALNIQCDIITKMLSSLNACANTEKWDNHVHRQFSFEINNYVLLVNIAKLARNEARILVCHNIIGADAYPTTRLYSGCCCMQTNIFTAPRPLFALMLCNWVFCVACSCSIP